MIFDDTDFIPVTFESEFLYQRGKCVKMAKKQKDTLDFQAILEQVNADFPTYQALDKDGKIVNPDLVPDLSDDELVELMTRMVWSRVLDQRSTALNRQGRLGFFRANSWSRSKSISKPFCI